MRGAEGLIVIDFGKLELSLKRLEEQHANYLSGNPALSGLDREGVAESVIQRFETCYDCLWKVLKRHLIERLGVTDPPNSPKPLFRIANENLLLSTPVEQWLRYADARTDTSHDYDGEKAKACLQIVANFIADSIALYESMSGKTWR